MPVLLTLAEAAAMLRRPEATLRYWRATSVGPRSARLQGRIVYREADVIAWIDAQFEDAAST